MCFLIMSHKRTASILLGALNEKQLNFIAYLGGQLFVFLVKTFLRDFSQFAELSNYGYEVIFAAKCLIFTKVANLFYSGIMGEILQGNLFTNMEK